MCELLHGTQQVDFGGFGWILVDFGGFCCLCELLHGTLQVDFGGFFGILVDFGVCVNCYMGFSRWILMDARFSQYLPIIKCHRQISHSCHSLPHDETEHDMQTGWQHSQDHFILNCCVKKHKLPNVSLQPLKFIFYFGRLWMSSLKGGR